MSDLAQFFKAYLKSKPAITNLIGAGDDAKVYENKPKEGQDPPYIVFEIFEGESFEHLEGISGVATNRVQVDAYGIDSGTAHDLAEAIRLAPLQRYRGMMDTAYVHGVGATGGYRTGIDRPTTGGNQLRYWRSRDYFITYSEPITA